MTQPGSYTPILGFWFDEIEPVQWWQADPTFDARVRDRFLAQHRQAVRGELSGWRTESRGRLAEVIVLDQFSRNLFRNTPLAFAQDLAALVLAQEAVAADAHLALSPIERSFLYLPFMHSESRLIHEWAERLYRVNGLPENHAFELKHKTIIDRFGRYPHRNEILGRESTDDELEFLKEAGSSF